MTKTEARRAATILRREAAIMRRSNVNLRGEFDDPRIEADHDEMKHLARELDRHARTLPNARGYP